MKISKKRIGVTVLFFVIAIVAVLWMFVGPIPNVAILKTHYPVRRPVAGESKKTVDFSSTPPPSWIRLHEISKDAKRAIVISEDWAFYRHKGFDTKQIREAIKKNWRMKKYARGASTITQQVARNVFFEKKKTLSRKIRELIAALLMEKKLTKSRILEIYLNIAEWGENIYGIRPASTTYFQKHPSGLTAKEGAFLAMLLPSPKRYSASFREKELTPYAKKTIESILQKMVRAGALDQEEATFQKSTPLSFETREVEPRFEWFPTIELNDSEEEDDGL